MKNDWTPESLAAWWRKRLERGDDFASWKSGGKHWLVLARAPLEGDGQVMHYRVTIAGGVVAVGTWSEVKAAVADALERAEAPQALNRAAENKTRNKQRLDRLAHREV